MKITRTSIFTGLNRTKDLPITQSQMNEYNNGEFSQIAFHNLCASDREFIKTGVTTEEWDKFMPEEESHIIINSNNFVC